MVAWNVLQIHLAGTMVPLRPGSTGIAVQPSHWVYLICCPLVSVRGCKVALMHALQKARVNIVSTSLGLLLGKAILSSSRHPGPEQ